MWTRSYPTAIMLNHTCDKTLRQFISISNLCVQVYIFYQLDQFVWLYGTECLRKLLSNKLAYSFFGILLGSVASFSWLWKHEYGISIQIYRKGTLKILINHRSINLIEISRKFVQNLQNFNKFENARCNQNKWTIGDKLRVHSPVMQSNIHFLVNSWFLCEYAMEFNSIVRNYERILSSFDGIFLLYGLDTTYHQYFHRKPNVGYIGMIYWVNL